MEIREIKNKTDWTDFFDSVGSPSFHHAWEWGEFQKDHGYDILRLGIYDNKKLVMAALVIKIGSKRGRFLFIPHGPLFQWQTKQLQYDLNDKEAIQAKKQLECFLEYLRALAKAENYWFIRIAPILRDTEQHNDIFAGLNFRKAPIYMHAETMWAVDLSPSEEELMKNMRKTTRYLIRKALKLGISVSKHQTVDALEDFWELYEVTFTREDFTPFPKKYIAGEFSSFDKSKKATFFLGRVPQKFAQEGASEILAGSLVLFTKSCGFYHQGASIHSDYPVPYLLQWTSMLEAKRRGCQFYNFYGIYKEGRTPTAWKGLSLFKQGFGGFEINYLPTQDYVISPKYYFSYAIDRYLSWRRGI